MKKKLLRTFLICIGLAATSSVMIYPNPSLAGLDEDIACHKATLKRHQPGADGHSSASREVLRDMYAEGYQSDSNFIGQRLGGSGKYACNKCAGAWRNMVQAVEHAYPTPSGQPFYTGKDRQNKLDSVAKTVSAEM